MSGSSSTMTSGYALPGSILAVCGACYLSYTVLPLLGWKVVAIPCVVVGVAVPLVVLAVWKIYTSVEVVTTTKTYTPSLTTK